MSDIVLLSGSPSPDSGSVKVLDTIGSKLMSKEYSIAKISVIDIPLADLFYGRYNSPTIAHVIKEIKEAKGIVISSPVYKAAYTGVLKLLFDILPMDAFRGKVVLPMMTGGSSGHLLALEYTLKPLISLLKGNCLSGIYITDSQLDKKRANPIIDDTITERIEAQINQFSESIQKNNISI